MLAWMKYQCFEKGIPPQVFKQMQMRDLLEIFAIGNAIKQKQIRQAFIDQAIAEMQSKW